MKDNRLKYFVYILKCRDGFYVGCTNNPEERISRHESGYVAATKLRRPLELLNTIGFTDKYKAFAFENYLKSGSGRAFAKKHF